MPGMQKKIVYEYFGTYQAIADALHITHQAVQQWGPLIPELAALKLDRATNGELKYDEDAYKKAPARDDLTGA